jgi:hypothetical protein
MTLKVIIEEGINLADIITESKIHQEQNYNPKWIENQATHTFGLV